MSAVASRRRSGPSLARLAVPALAVASVLVALSVLSRTTLPGDPLYPVRRVLQTTGVTRSPIEDVDRLLRSAERAIERGERLENDRPVAAEDAAVSALGDLGEAETIATEVGAPDRLEAIAELKEEAADLLQDASEERAERAADDSSDGSGPDDSDDDSGSGGGDDSAGDDNSGSGSDDADDDNSGPGGGGSGGDDNSGSGSDDADDDNSGTGGGGSDDDSSGSG